MQRLLLNRPGFDVPGAEEALAGLMAREPCVFEASQLWQLRAHLPLISAAVSRTSMVILSVPELVAEERGFSELLGSLRGLFAVSVRYRLAGPGGNRYSGAPQPGREGDLRVLEHYQRLRESFLREGSDSVRVIPEIELTDELQLLGPTLMALSRFSPPWMMLAVEDEPTKKRASALRSCFEYLQIRGFPLIDVHFPFERNLARKWVSQSDSCFSGPEEFHIDLSNRCTHSCLYCAVYSPAIIDDLKATNRMDEAMQKFMSAQLDEEKALELIQSLPVTTRLVQLGGAGDPMLHPRALELISHLRERAISVEVLSNMEYLREGDHEKLNALGGKLEDSLRFFVNLSAATPETYVRTRPRQAPAVFHKVIANLRRLSMLREASGGMGAHFVMMCVVNRHNYHEAPLYVELAKEVGADQVWFKPLEIHHRFHYDLLPAAAERSAFSRALRQAIERAEALGVAILDVDTLLETICTNEAASESHGSLVQAQQNEVMK